MIDSRRENDSRKIVRQSLWSIGRVDLNKGMVELGCWRPGHGWRKEGRKEGSRRSARVKKEGFDKEEGRRRTERELERDCDKE